MRARPFSLSLSLSLLVYAGFNLFNLFIFNLVHRIFRFEVSRTFIPCSSVWRLVFGVVVVVGGEGEEERECSALG